MVYSIDLYEYFRLSKTDEDGVLHAYFHDDSTPRITVLVVPGGAYGERCFRENKPIAKRLFNEGFNACYLDYTCGDKARYPVALQEGGMAVVYLREYLQNRGLDEQTLLIIGFSAGGHLVGHISNPQAELHRFSFLTPKQKALWRVDGTAYGYPVVSTRQDCIHEGSFRNLLKDEFDVKKDEVSLENLITERSAPAFLFHCSDDSVVPVKNSLLLAEAYAKKGVPFELHVFPKGEHGVALPTLECWAKEEMYMVNPDLIVWWQLFTAWAKKLGSKRV